MNYFDSNSCSSSFHSFARSGEGDIDAFHSDNTPCEAAEFNLADLLDDDLPTMYRCPWCDKNTLDTEHMRVCSNYKPAPTADEIRDAYSHPTEHAKRDALLRDMGEEIGRASCRERV